MCKILKSFFYAISFFVVFIATYCIHVYFFNVNVVLYSSLLDILIAALIFLFISNKFSLFSYFTKIEFILLLVISIQFSYIFCITLPTIIDRSLSIYLLEKIDQRGGSIQKDKISNIIISEYLTEHHVSDVRITEQLNSGTIVKDDNCLYLTKKGRVVVRFTQFFRKNLLPKHRLIGDSYSDALINPLKESSRKEYSCQ
jgi:hypothetical protein